MAEPAEAPKEFYLNEPARKLRESALALVTDDLLKVVAAEEWQRETIAVTLIWWTLLQAMRQQWYDRAEAAGIGAELKIGRKMMADVHFTYPKDTPVDFIIGPPGMPVQFMNVDGKEAYVLDFLQSQAMPLSAYYTNKVREAIDLAAEVGALMDAQKEQANGSRGLHQDSGGGGSGGGNTAAGSQGGGIGPAGVGPASGTG